MQTTIIIDPHLFAKETDKSITLGLRCLRVSDDLAVAK